MITTTSDPVAVTASIIMNREVTERQFLMSLRAPACFPMPVPGQFVMIRVENGHDPLLRRPLSIYAFDRGKDYTVVETMYQIVGKGTKQLSRLLPDSKVSVMGPLGRGFAIVPDRKNVVIIAGGIGIAPLCFLAGHYMSLIRPDETAEMAMSPRIICYIGAKTADSLSGLEKLEGRCQEIKISTDDGSRGYHGTVVGLFRKDLASYDPDDAGIYACGPAPMLEQLAGMLAGKGITCQVSMEERMACGLGACLGCAVSLRGGNGKIIYKRVCKDGPVFNIQDVVWT